MSATFAHLRPEDEHLFRLGSLAQCTFPADLNTSLLKLQRLGEVLVQQLASRFAVELRLQQAFPRRHGDSPNGAVLKISGNGDKPAWLFRRFKEDSFPTVAVNVDLLTTGVDLPEIGQIVVLRCVSSRIFDPVAVYDALRPSAPGDRWWYTRRFPSPGCWRSCKAAKTRSDSRCASS